MPSKIHNDKYCRVKKEDVVPNKKGKCSSCGAELAPILFEDESVYLLRNGLLYALEPKTAKSYKTKYQDALEVK